MLYYLHGKFSIEQKFSEFVVVIVKKRPDLVQHQIDGDKQLIKTILQQGKDRNEFDIDDTDEMASYVQAAIVKFSSPFFIAMFPIEELERLAKGVVVLILNGLVKH